MANINDNVCECGHARVQHQVNNKFEAKACTLNQVVCDCWQFKYRKQLSEHAIALILSESDIKINGRVSK